MTLRIFLKQAFQLYPATSLEISGNARVSWRYDWIYVSDFISLPLKANTQYLQIVQLINTGNGKNDKCLLFLRGSGVVSAKRLMVGSHHQTDASVPGL